MSYRDNLSFSQRPVGSVCQRFGACMGRLGLDLLWHRDSTFKEQDFQTPNQWTQFHVANIGLIPKRGPCIKGLHSGVFTELTQKTFFLLLFIIGCLGQLARTSTNSGALKITIGYNLQWPQGLKYLTSVRIKPVTFWRSTYYFLTTTWPNPLRFSSKDCLKAGKKGPNACMLLLLTNI